jgi:spore protease
LIFLTLRRTDLAVEAHLLQQNPHELSGVKSEERVREGFVVTTVEVTDRQGAEALGKPIGTYVSIELEGVLRREENAFPRAVSAIAAELKALLPLTPSAPVLVVGLGNRAITPDLLGPLAAEHILVTRHLVEGVPEHFGSYRPVSVLIPGVLTSTGVESAEITAALAGKVKPAALLVIDALAARSLDRICRTLQISTTGITPGSGVGNHRAALDRETLGISVLSMGVPTVVDGATLALDILAQAGAEEVEPELLRGQGSDLFGQFHGGVNESAEALTQAFWCFCHPRASFGSE